MNYKRVAESDQHILPLNHAEIYMMMEVSRNNWNFLCAICRKYEILV